MHRYNWIAFRTAYHGKYFEALTTDIRKSEIKSIDDIAARDFTIFAIENFSIPATFDIFKRWNFTFNTLSSSWWTIFLRINFSLVSTDEFYKYLDTSDDYRFDGSVMVLEEQVMFEKFLWGEKRRLKLLEQRVLHIGNAWIFPRNHFLYPAYNAKLQQLVTGGFFQNWLHHYSKHRNVLMKPPVHGPITLNMDLLGISFQIWIVMLLFSFAVFLCEILFYWLLKKLFRIVQRQLFDSIHVFSTVYFLNNL